MEINEKSTLSIKEVATQTNLSVHTLRYYEKIGLISSIPRNQTSNYRQYTMETLQMIESLACLRATGMSIADMRTYLKNLRADSHSAKQQRELFEKHAGQVSRKIQKLQLQKLYLKLKVRLWRARENNDEKAERQAIEEIIPIAKKLRNINER